MAMGTQRSSKALHNFTMPPDLRWGNQRFLRCINLASSNAQISPPPHPRSDRPPPPHILNGSHTLHPPDEITAIREKVMFDLQTAADKIKDSIFKDGVEEAKVSISTSLPPDGEVHRPWNLRTRRAGCKTVDGESAGAGGRTLTVDAAKPNSSNSQKQGGDKVRIGEKREGPKFSVALSKREIEEDYLQMVGHRPPRRPKKRARTIQRQLDTLFPGLWLSPEITADLYKVSEDVS